MSKVVHLRLTGRAERFVENIVRKTGLSERDVMAKALWLLERAATTGEVAEKKTRFSGLKLQEALGPQMESAGRREEDALRGQGTGVVKS